MKLQNNRVGRPAATAAYVFRPASHLSCSRTIPTLKRNVVEPADSEPQAMTWLCFGLRTHVTDVVHQVPGFRKGVTYVAKGLPDSDDVSPMSRQGSGFSQRVNDVTQSTFRLRTHVTDVVQQASGFRRGVTDVTRGFRI
ncbi:unnamed protein product [Heligmosomoides polygyrus]|uniref:Kinesin motor domain-containing protein n=1 Tax=Heligmosomoides polygyrus TaxID=6339 RepID=A0A183FKZ9_HELPZ|nr:unnamed protein product [Heligmosomoides polygyrus]